MDDRELNQLLHEWRAPDAPPGLRPHREPQSWLRWLAAGTVRVPALMALAFPLLTTSWVALTWPGPFSRQSALPVADRSAPRPAGELARYALTGALEGFDAVLVELNFATGASAQEHRHPGPILGYVVDGQMRFAINHEADQIVPAGGTFFEPPGALHTTFGSGSPDAPVRIVAFLVVPNGSPLTERATAPRQP